MATAGVKEIVSYHEWQIDNRAETKADILSERATAMVILARSRGLAVEVDSDYVDMEFVADTLEASS
jgi:hypothetical protein